VLLGFSNIRQNSNVRNSNSRSFNKVKRSFLVLNKLALETLMLEVKYPKELWLSHQIPFSALALQNIKSMITNLCWTCVHHR